MAVYSHQPGIINSCVFAIILALGIWPGTSTAAPVHIEVDTGRYQEFGAGISVGNGQDCFIVVPHHVVEFARSIVVTDQQGRSAKAARYQAADGVDAELLKVEAGHSLDCPEDWNDGSSSSDNIRDAEFLVSRKVTQQSVQQRRFFLAGETSTTISLQPFGATDSDRLKEGDSGSSLYANNVLIGMIVSVDTADGSGLALKQNQLHALFGNLILDQSSKTALINPVYYRNKENPYATLAVRNFIGNSTHFDPMELTSFAAAENVKRAREGLEPAYPEDIDYVISCKIIEDRSRNEANPGYDSSAARENNLAKKMLNNLGNKSVRYNYISNIDIEVQIQLPKENRVIKNIEQLEYKIPLKENVDRKKLQDELPVRATVEALQATMIKYGLQANLKQEKKPTSILDRFFKKK